MDAVTQMPARTRARRRSRRVALIFVAAIGAVSSYYGWQYFTANHYVSTDDAYVGGNVISATARTPGTVTRIYADVTDHVQAGEVLIQLDPTDARVALGRARAELAIKVRDVAALRANMSRLDAEVARQVAVEATTREDFQHREALASTGAIAREELRHARESWMIASASLDAARQDRRGTQVKLQGTQLSDHPAVSEALANLHDAALALLRTTIRAPVSGMVARRDVQLGQHVVANASLLSIVSLDNLWVDSNFKENQLEHVCRGQQVRMTADVYGGNTTFHGRVEDITAGSGSAFALLPAQNATGNWIKVVQRIPVRISLDPEELRRRPLRMGSSMNVQVDVSGCSEVPAAQTSDTTQVYDEESHQADAQVAQILSGILRSVEPSEARTLTTRR